MIIYNSDNDIEFGAAIDAIVSNGIVGVEGTKTHATKIIDKLMGHLRQNCEEIAPVTGFKMVEHSGYLYYIFDSNRYSTGDKKLETLIKAIDTKYSLLNG